MIFACAEFVDFMQHSYLCVATVLGCSLRKVSISCAKIGDSLGLWKMSLCRGVFYLQGPQEQSDALAYPGTSLLGMTIFVSTKFGGQLDPLFLFSLFGGKNDPENFQADLLEV